MHGIANEVLFYGGIAISAGSLAAAVIYLIGSHIQKIRLDTQLDEEYGKEER